MHSPTGRDQQPPPQRLSGPSARQAAGAVTKFWSLGAERIDLDRGHLVRHPDGTDTPPASFLTGLQVTRPEQLDAVLARYRAATGAPCQHVLVDQDTSPTAEAHLALNGWHSTTQLHLVLPATMHPPDPTGQLTPIHAQPDGWRELESLFRSDHIEEDATAARPTRPVSHTRAAVTLRRRMSPPARYFLRVHDDAIVGCVGLWVHRGLGVIEDLYVRPHARQTGLATDMLRFAIARIRASRAGPAVISAEVDDTPKRLYARFGFEPVALTRHYRSLRQDQRG